MGISNDLADSSQSNDIVTVVIPTYNRAGLLRRAIDSIRQQSNQAWKLVVIDNASPDNTTEVVAELMREDARISYHRHSENIGMLPNWDFAVSAIETDYFALLCDDDYVLPGFLTAVMSEMHRNPGLGLCFGSAVIVDGAGQRLGAAPNEMATGYYAAGEGASAMLKLQHPATPAIVFRSKCVNLVGGFDQRSHFVADLDMILRVSFNYPIKYIADEVACYVVHAGNSFKDISGWHPGLLNVIRSIKKMELADKSHQEKVFKSFRSHAIQPLLNAFVSHPIKQWNPKVLRSAVQCLIETRQVLPVTLSLLKYSLISVRYRVKNILISVIYRVKSIARASAKKIYVWLKRG